jgi:hypothetical protein
MMRTKKIIKRTKPKPKPSAKPNTKAKVKIKPKFNLKGIPAKFKWICTLAINHANTQIQCDELLLVGVNAFESLHETETTDIATKNDIEFVTQAIVLKKESYIPEIDNTITSE